MPKRKAPAAAPISTFRPTLYLGYLVGREDICLGPKARHRLRKHLRRCGDDAERAAEVIRSFAAAWMFST